MLLRGMLSKKELDGFLNSCETCKQPDIMGEVDGETPTDGDRNLEYSRSNPTVRNT